LSATRTETHVILAPIPGLTIGIDARAATEEIAGGGRVVRELLRALAAGDGAHRYVLYARTRWDEPLDERFTWALSPAPGPRWNVLAARAAGRACDVLLSTNSYLPAWFTRIPTVLEVYDLVAFDRALRPSPRAGAIERATLGPAVRRAAGMVCISQATADALTQRYPSAAGKVTVALLGSSPALKPDPAMELPERFVLAVGTLEPRKNLPRLVEAYAGLPETLQAAHPLLVAGRIGWEAAETLDALEGLGDRCRLLGPVSDPQLAALYQRCTVFCYPSLAEGFGLPVLEAMAAGAPVITSDTSSLPEVGGDAVEYVTPTATAAIGAALQRLLGDPERCAALSEAGRTRAQHFSWARHAELTLGALERATRERSGLPGAAR
jgi:glycosyltransferase involved in cell wall biosynthesis